MLDQTEPQSSASTDGSPSCAGVLIVRLWTTDEAGEFDPMFWKGGTPAVSLIVDLIAASEGVAAATYGNILVANFSDIQSAVAAARRLEWAVQGFTEVDNMHGTAAAVLVHSAEEQPDQTADSPFLPLLNQAAPGQILLTEKPCKFLHDLPGFSLRATSEAGLQELLWRGPEVESARCFDEQSLAQLIEQHGLEVEAEAESKESSTTDPGSTTGVGDAGPPAQSGSKNVLLAALRSLPLGGKSLWLIGGACTAAFFVALVVIIALSHRNAPSSRIVATPKTETISSLTVSGSLAPATPVGQSVNPTKSGTENQATASQTRVRTPKDSRKKGVKPNPSARCDLDPHELLDELDTAERSLARGHYDDADRQFSAVLACEPGNGRARAGLERSRKAQTER